MEGVLLEEGDFEAHVHDLGELGGAAVGAAGAEFGEGEVAGASELHACGDEAGVEVLNGAEFDFDLELEGGGGEVAAVEDPTATIGDGTEDGGHGLLTVFVAIALDALARRRHGGSLSRAAGGVCPDAA